MAGLLAERADVGVQGVDVRAGVREDELRGVCFLPLARGESSLAMVAINWEFCREGPVPKVDERIQALEAKLKQWMAAALTRPQDRELFGLGERSAGGDAG